MCQALRLSLWLLESPWRRKPSVVQRLFSAACTCLLTISPHGQTPHVSPATGKVLTLWCSYSVTNNSNNSLTKRAPHTQRVPEDDVNNDARPPACPAPNVSRTTNTKRDCVKNPCDPGSETTKTEGLVFEMLSLCGTGMLNQMQLKPNGSTNKTIQNVHQVHYLEFPSWPGDLQGGPARKKISSSWYPTSQRQSKLCQKLFIELTRQINEIHNRRGTIPLQTKANHSK